MVMPFNLEPPPETNDINLWRDWFEKLYEFLKYPHFHQIRFIARATPSKSVKGVTYLDSDDNTMKTHNGTDFQDYY